METLAAHQASGVGPFKKAPTPVPKEEEQDTMSQDGEDTNSGQDNELMIGEDSEKVLMVEEDCNAAIERVGDKKLDEIDSINIQGAVEELIAEE